MLINDDLLKNVNLKLNNINTQLNGLSSIYQSKIISNHNAWTGKTNKVQIPVSYYGFYLVISMSPYGDWSMYTLCVLSGTTMNSRKIGGTKDTTFNINGKELSITMSESGYWASFVLFLGNVI